MVWGGHDVNEPREFKAVSLERYAILKNEVLTVTEGFVMVCGCRVLINNGFVRLFGLLRLGQENV